MPMPSLRLVALASAWVVQASTDRQGVGKTELALPGSRVRAWPSQARAGRGTSTKPIGISTARMERPSQASARVFTTLISSAPSAWRRQTTQPVRQPSAPATIKWRLPLGHLGLEVGVERCQEIFRVQEGLLGIDQDREILGHLAALDRLDTDLLERVGELHHVGRAVERAAVLQSLRPGEDRSNRVGRGRPALLVLAIVARHRAVRGFGLNGLAVWRQ